jgi:hypothetical protein
MVINVSELQLYILYTDIKAIEMRYRTLEQIYSFIMRKRNYMSALLRNSTVLMFID